MKKFGIRMLMFALVMQLLPLIANPGKAYAETCPAWEYDTDGSTILIDSALELSCIRNNLGGNYKLTADIDLAGVDYGDGNGWKPIGDFFHKFSGTFNGNGYAIRNMTINRPTNGYVGLFGSIDTSAKLIGIHLLDVNVTGYGAVGGVAGQSWGTIRYSYVTGQVEAQSSDSEVGGLVGDNVGGSIENSYATADVTGQVDVGGVAGMNADGTISNSYATGNVTATGDIAISGVLFSSVGGLVGENDGSVEYSYSTGLVNGPWLPGGFVGWFQNSYTGATITNSFWNIETSNQGSGVGYDYAGYPAPDLAGIASDSQMQSIGTYNSWSIVDTGVGTVTGDVYWGIRDGETYPYLLAFAPDIEVNRPNETPIYNLSAGQDELTVTGAVYDGSIGEQVDITIAVYDGEGATVTDATYQYSIDADPDGLPIDHAIPLDGFNDGSYSVKITAQDTNHIVTSDPIDFKVDSTGPDVDVNMQAGAESFASGSWTNQDVTVSASVYDPDGFDIFTYSFDGGADQSYSTPITIGQEGEHTIAFHATDDLGNVTDVTKIVNIEKIAPTVTFATNGSGATTIRTASTAVTISDSGGSGVNDASLKYVWTADTATPAADTGWNDFASGDTLTHGGADGAWYLHIQAADAAGNTVNAVSDRFILDNTAPTISITQAPGSDVPTSEPVTVTVETDGTGSAIIKTKWAEGLKTEGYFSTGGSLLTGNSFQVAANGTYTVYTEDKAGNGTVETVDIDNIISELPQIHLTYSPTAITNGSITVSVTADVYGDTNALTQLNWLAGSHDAADFSGGTSGNDILSEKEFSVTTNGTYTVYAKDRAGNENVTEISVNNIITKLPELVLSFSPITSTNGTVTVNVAPTLAEEELGNTLAVLNWLTGSQNAADFSGGANGTDILAAKEFTVATNGTYTVYAKDAAGNEAVEEIVISNRVTTPPVLDLSYSPSTSTNGPVTVNVAATLSGEELGNTLAKLNWLTGSHDAADFSGGVNGADILAAKEFTVATNGAYTVYAKDAAGNEAVEEISISNIVIPPSEPVNDEEDSKPEPAPSFESKIVKNSSGGISLHIGPSDIVKVTLEDGRVMENVVLSDKMIEQVMQALEQSETPLVNIEIDDTEQAVQVGFPAASLAEVLTSHPDAVFNVQLNGSSFQLQAKVLDLKGLAAQLGVDVKDLKVNVIISQVNGKEKDQLTQVAGSQHLKLIGNPVDYQVTVSAGDKTLAIKDFGGTYMVRAIVLNQQHPGSNLIAVWYNPDTKTFSFVPAALNTRGDGKWEMAMKVPHNSIYAVMASEGKTFSDLNDHWAKDDVELLASKLIISGVSADRFAPNQSITRAEFTALLVRSLGLRTEDTAASSPFVDVDAHAWYAPTVATAVRTGLVQGMDAHHFAPNVNITREQMAVMIANALKLLGKPVIQEDGEKLLEQFSDYDKIAVWAKHAVALSVAAGIIHGFPNHSIAPNQFATRAEAAVMLKGFLQAVEFIE